MTPSLPQLWAVLLACRLLFTVYPQPGYIHPDEFFQSTEIVVGDVLGVETERTWEFNASSPVRTAVLPHLAYGWPVRLLAVLGPSLPPSLVPYLLLIGPRVAVALLLAGVDAALWKAASKGLGTSSQASLVPGVALCLHASSYLAFTYLTRTLSNTLECLLSALVLCIALLRISHSSSSSSSSSSAVAGSNKTKTNGNNNVKQQQQQQLKKQQQQRKQRQISGSGGGGGNHNNNNNNNNKKNKKKNNNNASSSSQQQQKQKQQQQQQQNHHHHHHHQKQQQQQQQQQKQKQKQQTNKPQQQHHNHHHQQQQQKRKKKGGGGGSGSTAGSGFNPSGVSSVTLHAEACLLGVCLAVGTFNRPTFALFSAVPIFAWIYAAARCESCRPSYGGKTDCVVAMLVAFSQRALQLFLYAALASGILVYADTLYYHNHSASTTLCADLHEGFNRCLKEGGAAGGSGGVWSTAVGTGGCMWRLLSTRLVVTPLNFVLYNTQASNLAAHGLHPRFLHALVNMPLLFHLLYAVYLIDLASGLAGLSAFLGLQLSGNQKGRKSSSSSSAAGSVSGSGTLAGVAGTSRLVLHLCVAVPLLTLSLFPHQEPRFLLPLLPPLVLLGASAVPRLLPGSGGGGGAGGKRSRDPRHQHQHHRSVLGTRNFWVACCSVWVATNAALAIFYGVLHQGGVVPSLLAAAAGPSAPCAGVADVSTQVRRHLVYYHTYMPPRHLLLLDPSRGGSSGSGSESPGGTFVHDLMGAPPDALATLILKLLPSPSSSPDPDLQRASSCVALYLPATLAGGPLRRALGCGATYSCEEAGWYGPHLSLEHPPHWPASPRSQGGGGGGGEGGVLADLWDRSLTVLRDLHLKTYEIKLLT